MNEIHVVQAGDIVFVDHPKYYEKALHSKATIVLINKEVECPEGKALLISDDPFRDSINSPTFLNLSKKQQHSIALSARIGENTVVQPSNFCGEQCSNR